MLRKETRLFLHLKRTKQRRSPWAWGGEQYGDANYFSTLDDDHQSYEGYLRQWNFRIVRLQYQYQRCNSLWNFIESRADLHQIMWNINSKLDHSVTRPYTSLHANLGVVGGAVTTPTPATSDRTAIVFGIESCRFYLIRNSRHRLHTNHLHPRPPKILALRCIAQNMQKIILW